MSLPSILFTACVDWVSGWAVDQICRGSSVGASRLLDLNFANDAMIPAETLKAKGLPTKLEDDDNIFPPSESVTRVINPGCSWRCVWQW